MDLVKDSSERLNCRDNRQLRRCICANSCREQCWMECSTVYSTFRLFGIASAQGLNGKGDASSPIDHGVWRLASSIGRSPDFFRPSVAIYISQLFSVTGYCSLPSPLYLPKCILIHTVTFGVWPRKCGVQQLMKRRKSTQLRLQIEFNVEGDTVLVTGSLDAVERGKKDADRRILERSNPLALSTVPPWHSKEKMRGVGNQGTSEFVHADRFARDDRINRGSIIALKSAHEAQGLVRNRCS